MSVLQVFATPEELEQTLQAFVARYELRACREEAQTFKLLEDGSPLVLQVGAAPPAIFLFPAEAWNASEAPKPRDEGWMQVSHGQLCENNDKRILTLSTIQAEDRSHLSFKPASWLRALKKRLTATYTFGVVGRNVVHGGSAVYRDIAYSPLALELRDQEVVWKQFENGNSEFFPL